MKKAGKVLLSGLLAAIFCFVYGMIVDGGLFGWAYKLEPTHVWKPMEGPPGADFTIGLLFLNIIFAYVYSVLNQGLPYKNLIAKGAVYGVLVWAVGMLPGMFYTQQFMDVNNIVIILWTVSGLIDQALRGLIVAFVYGK